MGTPHVFFQYQVFLFQELQQILLKAPFLLVPQFTMKRRSITLGVEQVAELMLCLSKKMGLLESLGIDFDAIPSCEDVVLTNNDKRIQKQQMEKASRGKKRQRVQELTDVHLPDQKRLRTMDDLRKARKALHARCSFRHEMHRSIGMVSSPPMESPV
jgi:hypothetical protein